MAKAYYIPNGTANLSQLFPSIDFTQVAECYVELIDSSDTVIATTPLSQICGCDDPDDQMRIHFLNALGAVDAINFKKAKVEHEAKSERFERPVSYPLNRTLHAQGRFNIKANDIITIWNYEYTEAEMDWLNELVDSPVAWVEKEGKQGMPATFIPIIILDAKVTNMQLENRFIREIELQYTMSHPKFTIRN